MMGARRQAQSESGITLVETIVVMVILLIVLGVVATSLTFAFRMMTEERILSNADTLNATVRNSVEDALRYASFSSDPVSADGNGNANGKITFTTKQDASYRKAGTYAIFNGPSGQVQITNGKTSGSLLPSPTYIDGDTVKCTFSVNDGTVHVTTIVTCKAGDRAVDSYVDVLNDTDN